MKIKDTKPNILDQCNIDYIGTDFHTKFEPVLTEAMEISSKVTDCNTIYILATNCCYYVDKTEDFN